ncbi:MAG: nuclear transport factor 2 family protein [Acidimicrobiales bacterium]
MDEAQVRRTLAQYCQLLDDGRFDEWIELFTDDGTMLVMGGRHEGRDAIRAAVEPNQQAEQRGRHLLSEPVIDIDGDRAVVTTDYAFVSRKLVVSSAGRYHDVLVRSDDRWRFASREIVFLGADR